VQLLGPAGNLVLLVHVMKFGTALFCVITQRIVVISYRRFGTIYRYQLQGSRNVSKKLPLYSNICPTGCNVTQFILSGNCSTCFGWYHHPSTGAQTSVSTASGICHTVTATCLYRGRVGTDLSVLWVVYTTHSTLKPVPALPR